ETLGIEAQVAIGHSLGEVVALHWAGAIDDRTCLRIAAARAAAMNGAGSPLGGMAAISATSQQVAALLNGDPVVIACLNSPGQTVVSGAAQAIDRFVRRVRAAGIAAKTLSVSHAFHSPLLAAAEPALADSLLRKDFQPLRRRVVSTVTGSSLSPTEDLRRLLNQQLVSPVRFVEAVSAACNDADLFIEVGPGSVLSGLVSEFLDRPVISLDVGGPSLEGLLMAVGAAYAAGAPVSHDPLFDDRFTRSFDLNWQPRFFDNPCEAAPLSTASEEHSTRSPDEDRPGAEVARTDFLVDRPEISTMNAQNVLELVRNLVAVRTELPAAVVKEDDRLLGDLHLNSITVSQLVTEAARHLGLTPPVSPIDYSTVRVIEVAQALEELVRTGRSSRKPDRSPAGIDHWTRCFKVEMVERPRSRLSHLTGDSDWEILAPACHPFAGELKQAFNRCPGTGVVVALPRTVDQSNVGLLLDGARAAILNKRAKTFVLVQHGRGAAALARTLHLEAPWITTCVVNVPEDDPNAVQRVIDEATGARGYVEAHYDSSGTRRVPVLQLMERFEEPAAKVLDVTDLILVSGGGKGIAAESAMSLALESGARLALLGRSEVEKDSELRANLERFKRLGIAFKYFAVDITESDAVRRAVAEAESEFGPVTAILHGAGANEARLIESLDEDSFRKTLAPKLEGARNLLGSIDPERLRIFIAFSSLIARTGMRGEADYALANEWLTALTEDWQKAHPHCRSLSVEWSAWSGAGMVQRLGRVDALIEQGITPLPVDEGVSILNSLLSQRSTPVAVVVTGRFGDAPTIVIERPELPLRRFLEHVRVYYPGIELVAESELSALTDRYLDDHVLNGDPIFPAVMSLEAMAQAATALLETAELPVFEQVSFDRPIVIRPGERSVLRVAALVRDGNCVEVAVRSEQTGYQVDHCRALCRFDRPRSSPAGPGRAIDDAMPVAIEPDADLYRALLFHNGRFRRVRGYTRIASTECVSQVEQTIADWFGPYLPRRLVLGDPGRRDASIHSIQVCVPDALLLPVRIERLTIFGEGADGVCSVEARERSREGDLFTYDVDVRGSDGCLVERWDGLALQVVKGESFKGPWVESLLAPYLERSVREFCKRTDISIAIERGRSDRRAASDRAIQRSSGAYPPTGRRPDGKPEVAGPRAASASHCGDVTLAMAAVKPVACDVEQVVSRASSAWEDLLGYERHRLSQLISKLSGESPDTSATRVWTTLECLKKAGSPPNAPLILCDHRADGWVMLASGRLSASTYVTSVKGVQEPLVFAMLVGRRVADA
ncbi:MAG TPA: SDR family NAD(P)-dependent oxidoreductase, partial [Blastocatellia bacterium]|nr:SDR family NAD(P)-dependent oxidoreductase [Blastocatellia bacterium]